MSGWAKELLAEIGEDADRQGLAETPARLQRAWQEWTSGYKLNPADVLKTFEDGAASYDELVLVSNIPVYSTCEHHLASFWGLAHVGYVPRERIVGLSKLARLVDIFARRLQVQERMTVQIAHALETGLKPVGVGVVLECRHMCMESRGLKVRGAITITSSLRGSLRETPAARAEFLGLVKQGRDNVPI